MSRPNLEERAVAKAADEARVAEATSKLTAAVDKKALAKTREILLNMPMPNGQRLRFCTMEEGEEMGPWFVTLAQRVGEALIPGATLAELVAA